MEGKITTKNFASHHKEAKVAISHIELLIKLATWADLPESSTVNAADAHTLEALLLVAQSELELSSDEEEEV